jgi:hypothetical protein
MSFFSSIGDFFGGIVDTVKSIGSSIDDMIINPIVHGDISQLGRNLDDIIIQPIKNDPSQLLSFADPFSATMQIAGNTVSADYLNEITAYNEGIKGYDFYSPIAQSIINTSAGSGGSSVVGEILKNIPSTVIARVPGDDPSKLIITAQKASEVFDISLPKGKDVSYYSGALEDLINQGYILDETNRTIITGETKKSWITQAAEALSGILDVGKIFGIGQTTSGDSVKVSSVPINIVNEISDAASRIITSDANTNLILEKINELTKQGSQIVPVSVPYKVIEERLVPVEKPVIVKEYVPFAVENTKETFIQTPVKITETKFSWQPAVLTGLGIVTIGLLIYKKA